MTTTIKTANNESSTSSKLQSLAMQFHEAGFNVFPVTGKDPVEVVKQDGTPGQYAWGRWQQNRQTTHVVRAMPWANASGVAGLGGPNPIYCIDVDSAPDDRVLTIILSKLGLPLNYEWVVETPGKIQEGKPRLPGYHIRVICPDMQMDKKYWDRPARTEDLADHIELRGPETYALLPGSLHPDGGTYDFLFNPDRFPEHPPATVTADQLNAAYDAGTKSPTPAPTSTPTTVHKTTHSGVNGNGTHGGKLPWVEEAFRKEIEHLCSLKPGDGRNTALNKAAYKLAGYLHAGVFTRSTLEEALFNASLVNGSVDKRGESQTRKTIRSGIEEGIRKPREVKEPGAGLNDPSAQAGVAGLVDDTTHVGGVAPGVAADNAQPLPSSPQTAEHMTDLGNAWRLVKYHGDDLRYVAAWGAWLIWDGNRWAKDETGEIERRAKATVGMIYREASNCQDEGQRKALAKWAVQSESLKRIQAMIALVKSEPGIAITPKQLDSDPMLFNCANGTLDLRTGTLKAADRADLITKKSEVFYDLHAGCPRWLKFLDRIMASDQEMIDFIQRAIGYSLTGNTREQCLFFEYGGGRNGKSTKSEVKLKMFGEYAQKAPAEMLMVKKSGGVPNDLARLQGARLIIAAEIGEGKHLAESIVKDLTGGDTITARFLHKEFFDFIPTHKIWMYGNHKPVIRGQDDGIWRRVHEIPFTVQIPKDEVDEDLKDKLFEELPGILAWAVRGCLEWQRGGLQVPGKVQQATAKYRSSMDVIGAFIDECCMVGSQFYVTMAELYKAYAEWCATSGEFAQTKRKFGDALTERGYMPDRGTGNTPIRWGLGLRTP